MLLSAVSVLVVAQSSSEIPEGLMSNPVFVEHTVMQQHNQQFTVVTRFGNLFRPSSDHASFRIKEKPYSHLNVKMGRFLVPMT